MSSAAISVPSSTAPAAHRQADAGADEEAAEHGREQRVGRHVGIGDARQHQGQAGDGQRAAHGEGAPQVAVAEGDERAG